MTQLDRAQAALNAAVCYYMSDKVQSDDLLRAKAYSAMFRAMQDFGIVKREIDRLGERIEAALRR